MKHKLVPAAEQKPTLVVWVLYDATTDVKYIKMRPSDGSLAIFDTEGAAMRAKRLYPGTDYGRREYYSAPQPVPTVQGEPVGRVKTVGGYPDESEHTIEWLCKYKDLKDGDLLYTAPQPAPKVEKLVKALEEIIHPVRFMQERLKEGERLNGMAAVQLAKDAEYLRDVAIAALTTYRKQGGEL